MATLGVQFIGGRECFYNLPEADMAKLYLEARETVKVGFGVIVIQNEIINSRDISRLIFPRNFVSLVMPGGEQPLDNQPVTSGAEIEEALGLKPGPAPTIHPFHLKEASEAWKLHNHEKTRKAELTRLVDEIIPLLEGAIAESKDLNARLHYISFFDDHGMSAEIAPPHYTGYLDTKFSTHGIIKQIERIETEAHGMPTMPFWRVTGRVTSNPQRSDCWYQIYASGQNEIYARRLFELKSWAYVELGYK